MKKTLTQILAVAAALAVTSCGGDFLDIEQHGVTGIDDFYKTDDDANEAVAAMYYCWSSMELCMFYVTNLPSDDMYAGGANRGANIAIENLADFAYDASNSWVETFYTYLYQLIYRANMIIGNFPEPATATQRQAVAEAHFFRAWAHFYLTVYYGTPPIVDHVLAVSEYTLPNSPREELWAFIESDLETAISSGDLAEKSGPDDVQVRITKGGAQSLLGKVYVWQEKWAEARTILDGVIESGKYALWDGDYADICTEVADFCCESVLEVNRLRDESNIIYALLPISVGWRAQMMDWSGKDGCDIYTSGWGQANPRKSLYDAFVSREGKDGYRLKCTVWDYDEVLSHGIKVADGKAIEQHDGYFAWKVRFSAKDIYLSYFYSGKNVRYMRYAEVLLLAAEAHLNGGDASKAANYVNQVRERAKLPALASVDMDDVKIEKRLELCYEGTRYMDLVRWGDAATVLADKDQKVGSFTDGGVWIEDAFTFPENGFKAGKHELFPFPRKETNVNTLLTQNPGW